MIDIVFPMENESEFIKLAGKLGKKEIIFAYHYQKDIKKIKERILAIKSDIKINFAIIASGTDILKAKNFTQFVIAKATGNDQHVIEKFKPYMIFDTELSSRRDPMHYRYSGLNQVLCKSAFRLNVTIGFSFSTLLNSKPSQRAVILGRMMQNLKLCKKYKCKRNLYSLTSNPYEMRSDEDYSSFLRILQ